MLRQQQRISRRTLLRSAALGGSGLVAAYLLGCGDSEGELNDLWELSAGS